MEIPGTDQHIYSQLHVWQRDSREKMDIPINDAGTNGYSYGEKISLPHSLHKNHF